MTKDTDKDINSITQLIQSQVSLPEHSNAVVDNNVYIFNYIEDDYRWHVLIPLHQLVCKLKIKMFNKVKEAKKKKQSKIEAEEINIFIDSGGGEVTLCWATCALLVEAKTYGILINTIIVGRASSAASYIAVLGDNRTMYECGYHGIHYGRDLSLNVQNKHCVETHSKRMLDNFNTTLKHYKKYTKAPKSLLDKWLKEEITYLSSEDCLKYSFIDSIIYM